MKLYATVTSERASKAQGGNKYIQANFTIEEKHVVSITLKTNEKRNVYEVWATWQGQEPKLIKELHTTSQWAKDTLAESKRIGANGLTDREATKGEKQKGELEKYKDSEEEYHTQL